MFRMLIAVCVGAVITMSPMTLSGHDTHAKGKDRVKVLSQRDIAEKLDGKSARVTTVEVTLAAQASRVPRIVTPDLHSAMSLKESTNGGSTICRSRRSRWVTRSTSLPDRCIACPRTPARRTKPGFSPSWFIAATPRISSSPRSRPKRNDSRASSTLNVTQAAAHSR